MNDTGIVYPRPDMVAAQVFGRVVSTFGITIITLIFVLEVFSFYEKRTELIKRARRRKMPYSGFTLLGVTVTGFSVMVMATVLFWLDWTGRSSDCDNFSKATYISYVFMKQFTYVFLFLRLKIVHDALKMDSLPVRAMRWTMILAATIGITAVYYPLIGLYFNGVVVPEGACVQFSHTPYVVMVFAITDLTLNLLLLGLFIMPLTRHVRSLDQNMETQLLLKRIAKRNLIISSIMMISTIAMLFFMLQSMLRINVTEEHPPVTFMQCLHTAFGAVDIIVNIVFAHVLSTSWIPAKARTYYKKLFGITIRTSRRTDNSNQNPRNGAKLDAAGNPIEQRDGEHGGRGNEHIVTTLTTNQVADPALPGQAFITDPMVTDDDNYSKSKLVASSSFFDDDEEALTIALGLGDDEQSMIAERHTSKQELLMESERSDVSDTENAANTILKRAGDGRGSKTVRPHAPTTIQEASERASSNSKGEILTGERSATLSKGKI